MMITVRFSEAQTLAVLVAVEEGCSAAKDEGQRRALTNAAIKLEAALSTRFDGMRQRKHLLDWRRQDTWHE